ARAVELTSNPRTLINIDGVEGDPLPSESTKPHFLK
ncbi:hypothetical protein LCGC14_2687730, partial [marine sediment metagenome]